MVDFKQIEKKWQKKWQESKIFETKPDKRKKFFITVPYPYVSGPYHIGHGRSYTCGDIFARFNRLKGYNVLFPMAFHITGTPVLAVSKSVQMKDKKSLDTLREYISYHTKDKKEIEKILDSFTEPINVYTYFSKTMKRDFNSLGMSIDWQREFTTADKIYNKFIEWQFLKFKEKKYLIKGSYPITFCLSCDNAVGEDDIKDGDTDPVSINEFTLVKFRLIDSKEPVYLTAATLRPETIFGQTNIWVKPDADYVKIRVNDEIWIASKEFGEKLSYQKNNIKTTGMINSNDLIGKKCFAPGIEREIIILPASFCDPDICTGIVTSVPSDAPYDLIALYDIQKKEVCDKYKLDYNEIIKIKPVPIIDTKEFGSMAAEKIIKQMNIKNQNETQKLNEATQIIYEAGFHSGVMNQNCGKYAGMPVAKAKELVKNELIKNKNADIFYETSRKAVCRCGGKVIIAKLKDQWFLDYNARGWKDLAYKCLDKMTIYPEKYRENFRSVFDWLDKRPCARRRGLGTKLPFDKDWIIESLSDSTIYMAFYTVAHIIKNSKIKPEQLIPEFFDYIFLNSGNAKDLAKKSKIQKSILEKIKNEFEYWYPVDQRHTAIMHISNHLSFFIFHHVAIFPEKYWPRTITLIEPVIVEGVKMGKSKGNVIPLAKVQEDFGADVFRLYMSHQAEFGTKMDWKAAEVYSTKKQLERFYDMFLQLSENKKFKPTLQTEIFLSKFTRKIKESMDYINNFNLRKYMQVAFYDVMNEIIKYKENRITPEVLRQWLILLSPVIPHICEEFWEKLKGKEEFVSLAKWPKIDEKLIKPDIEKIEEYLDNLITDIKQVISLSRIKKPNIYLFTAEGWKWNILGIMKSNKGDVGKTIKESINKYNEIDKSQITQFVQICAKKRLWDAELIKIKEEKVLKEQKGYLEKETGSKIYINEKTIIERRAKNRTTGEARQDYFKTDEKNKMSLPLKPAIYVE